MGSRFYPTEQQFADWEKRCESGDSYYVAAREVGTTLRGLKDFAQANLEMERYDFAVEASRERRAALVDDVMDTVVGNPELATPADRKSWAQANHPGYRDRSTLEISGTLNHDAKVVSLGDLLDAVRESEGFDLARLLDRPGRSLPGAQDVLPAPAEPEASPVPAERRT